jgi:hypothetical protein
MMGMTRSVSYSAREHLDNSLFHMPCLNPFLHVAFNHHDVNITLSPNARD